MVVRVTSEWSDTDLDELIEEILVDAYGDAEQLGAFECAFSEADFPVAALAIGLLVTMTGVWFAGDERRGLEADVLVEGQAHRIRLLDVQIPEGSHDVARLLAAFRRWWVPYE
jgi:hypothetical protein